jgi:catechol 2,3-dioxygenase-like lactoylglutathione lyase family enzyme
VIDHVSIAVSDLAASTRFYETLLVTLGMRALEKRPVTVGFGKTYPDFWINLRAGMLRVPDAGGAHVCFRARTAEIVDAFHAAALAAGGASAGAPGLRPQHGEGYYAAFVTDLDGNCIEAVTFVR